MIDAPVKLFGTEEAQDPPRLLAAGPLQALLERGALRGVRWRGVEVLRGLAFLVRGEGWTTPAAELSGLEVTEEPGRFQVRYQGLVRQGDAELSYQVELEGRAEGRLEARATIRPRTDFLTSRTGFVVLHPLAGVAGEAVQVEHVDGRVELRTLPALISPGQPLRELRAIAHSPARGLTATVRMEGDTFEMEDQRNWSDASFKTYSRPLALPYPYLLAAGAGAQQAVGLTVAEEPAAVQHPAAEAAGGAVALQLGGRAGGRMPLLGVAVPGELAAAALEVAAPLRAAAPSVLLARHDPSRGQGRGELAAVRALSEETGIPVALEVVLPGEEDPAAELGRVAADASAVRLAPGSLAVYRRVDERSFQPGEARPPGPTLEAIYRAARQAFPGLRLGGGTPAFFPELNRGRPPAELLDFVAHATCPIVHAADDRSLLETLEALPWIVRSARAIAGAAALHLGPSAIAARLNPYGSAPAVNPENRRVALASIDPRQRGLLGAAWTLGYAAAVAPLGLAQLALAAAVGPSGVVYTPQPFRQPWFDGRGQPAVFPAFHVLADLGEAAGQPLRAVEVADPARLAALAWERDGRARLALANLTAAPLPVRVEGWSGRAGWRLLDLESFERGCLEWRGFREERRPVDLSRALTLPPYAVAQVYGAP